MRVNNYTIKIGDYVIIREISGSQKLICVNDASKVFYLGKYCINGSDIIGKSYYTTLNFQEGEWKIGSVLNSEDILNDVINDEKESDSIFNDNNIYLGEDKVEENKRKKLKINPLLYNEDVFDSNLNVNETEVDSVCDNSGNIISLMRNEIISINKTSDNNLIKSLALLSDKFKNKTKYSKAKYIKKLQLRYLKQITLLPPSILNITETFSCQNKSKIMNKFSPNSVGPRWGQCTVRIESIGNILTHGNIGFDSEVLLYDNLSSGMVSGSIYRQLIERGSLYEISMNYLTFDSIDGYFHGKLPINFEALTHQSEKKQRTNYFSIPISALDLFLKEKEKQIHIQELARQINSEYDCLNIDHEWLNFNINNNVKFEISTEQLDSKKKRVFNRLNMLNKLYERGVNTIILAIDQVRWQNIQMNIDTKSSHGTSEINLNSVSTEKTEDEFNDQNVSDTEHKQVCENTHIKKYDRRKYCNIENLILITQEYLRPGGKLLIFTPFMTSELLKIHQDLNLSSRIDNSKYRPFIGIKLEETFIREHQIIDQRTHPTMDSNLPIFSGFLLSAILVS
ncbi:RNA methylase [Cryptosporidium xiaoi]|uniref:tRNA (adenine(58)-N(1))-methyltransferase non-catalytic subunit TRM6 n=1 Tax=Cryptosporidium xiaoi TaxID=659607 RepID=A0AAV9XVU3_9CRYT